MAINEMKRNENPVKNVIEKSKAIPIRFKEICLFIARRTIQLTAIVD